MAKSPAVSASSEAARSIFDRAAAADLHLALAELPVDFFDISGSGIDRDRETVTCLRSVLMKPEHIDWVGTIWERLDRATTEALGKLKS
jgi:hypothetical protein